MSDEWIDLPPLRSKKHPKPEVVFVVNRKRGLAYFELRRDALKELYRFGRKAARVCHHARDLCDFLVIADDAFGDRKLGRQTGFGTVHLGIIDALVNDEFRRVACSWAPYVYDDGIVITVPESVLRKATKAEEAAPPKLETLPKAIAPVSKQKPAPKQPRVSIPISGDPPAGRSALDQRERGEA